MGALGTVSENMFASRLDDVKRYFDPQLAKLNLTEEQIRIQSLPELKESLARINDAIAHPESFGELAITFRADASILISKVSSDYHHKIGVLPILLERKKLILERIKELSTDEKIEGLNDLITQVQDEQLKHRLTEELSALQSESKQYKQEVQVVALRETDERIRLQRELALQKIESFERGSKVWLAFLQRETVASIVGSIILLMLTFALVIAMFTNVTTSEIIGNAFLVVLGYFFGQGATRVTEKAS